MLRRRRKVVDIVVSEPENAAEAQFWDPSPGPAATTAAAGREPTPAGVALIASGGGQLDPIRWYSQTRPPPGVVDPPPTPEPRLVPAPALVFSAVQPVGAPDPVAPLAPAPVPLAATVTPAPPVLTMPVPTNGPTGGRMRIGELLVERRVITSQQLDYALAEQMHTGKRLGSELVRLGMLTERQLVEMLAQQLGLPIADLRQTTPDPDAVARFPEELARRAEVVPLRMINGTLELALADVLGDELRADLEAGAGCPIVAVLAPPSEIRQAIDRAYLVTGAVAQHVATFQALESNRPRPEETRLDVDDHAPVVQVVTLLLTQAVRDRASDIHIEPQGDRVRVRFRVDGVLREVTDLPQAMASSLTSRIKVMADMNIVERRRAQDGQIATEVDGRPLDIRVATTSTIFGEKAVLRLLDKTRGLLTLGELGMTPQTSAAISELVTAPFGMVACAGPTGSGKTTTLYAALKAIDDPSRNVTTIEDPVEYVMPSINQIQVNNQAGITFADGLRSILRQDPDVILVGEVRDVETARIAVQSALTGHLVLSSLHATDSATAIQRFRDMGIEPFLVTSSVLAVISQRLVRRICPHCRAPYEATPSERAFFEQSTGRSKEAFWHGAGCNLCSHTGYSHRVGVYELLRVTEPIRELVIADAGYERIRNAAISDGMRTLENEVLQLVDDDITTIAEAARTVFVH